MVDIRQPGVCFPEKKIGFQIVQIVQTDPVIQQIAYLMDTGRWWVGGGGGVESESILGVKTTVT